METLEQKKRRLYGKNNLDNYLKELNAITNIDVSQKDLLSIVESDKIVYDDDNSKFYKAKILFNDKERLLLFIGDLLKIRDGKGFLSTTYSNDSGLLEINSLKDFNVNFRFDDEHSGLITIVLKDLSNKLLLDFYEENQELYLEIETYGDDWSKARILI